MTPERGFYEVRLGMNGPAVAGPYESYEVAIRARSGMRRTLGMLLRCQRYWVVPAEVRLAP
jgi:hypothetical protein